MVVGEGWALPGGSGLLSSSRLSRIVGRIMTSDTSRPSTDRFRSPMGVYSGVLADNGREDTRRGIENGTGLYGREKPYSGVIQTNI